MGQTAKRMRSADFIKQVRGNPLVKEAPTMKTYYMLEHSPTKLHFLQKNTTRNVPYCDCFYVVEEWLILSPDPASQPIIKSSIIRLSFFTVWVKSTMMKSIIRSNVEFESKAAFAAFVDSWVKGKRHGFVEKKPPVR